ncbi:MAG: hypothetical protein HYY51_01480 [Candidatus Magasanikbacteria bacterium]|nr:hypothetical protein [Candidatus Magasanikbacteria bacterium]
MKDIKKRPFPPRGGTGTVAVAISEGVAFIVQYRNGKVTAEFEQGIEQALGLGIEVEGVSHRPHQSREGLLGSERRLPTGCRQVRGDPTRKNIANL